jgi:DNA repair protein RadA
MPSEKALQGNEEDLTELPGVGSATAEKLEKGGFNDLLSIAVSSVGQLSDAAGTSEAVARKIIQAARDQLEMGFQSGTEILERRKKVKKISVGCSHIDNMMDGGFETGSITECFGQYGSGKTQVALRLAVAAQQDYEDSTVVFIDTENTFRPERVVQFAEGIGADPDEMLNNIKVARAYNSDHQMLLSEKVEDIIADGHNVKLVVVDSLTAHFRAEYVGRGTLARRQQKLNKHMHQLAILADKYNLCVYVTNQVQSKPDQFFGDPTEAIGGNIVGHNSTYRIYLRRGRKGTRVAKLIDSPNLPDDECVFMITEDGLEDA